MRSAVVRTRSGGRSTTFGVSAATVSHACVENGVPLKASRPNGLARGTYKLIGELCTTDKSLTVLAGEYGVSVQRVGEVYRNCLDAGVPVRKRVQGVRQDRVE